MSKQDEAANTNAFFLDLAIKQQARTNAVLTHVNTSDICTECYGQIHPKRKELLPHAHRCADCQQLFEQKQKHYR